MNYKTQEEYLVYLAEELKYLKPKDAKQVLNFYQHKINTALDYGEKIEQILKNLPTPEQVALDTYESHGFKYKELRMKKNKQQSIIQKITNSIFVILITLGLVGVLFLLSQGFGKLIDLLKNVLTINVLLDKVITTITIISYILCMLFIVIYIIDIFYFLLMVSITKIFNINEETKERLLSFSINEFLSKIFKIKRVTLTFLLSFLALTIIGTVSSYMTNGYVYRSIHDLAVNETISDEYQEITNINIDSSNVKINVYNSDNVSYKYHYEFNNKLNVILDNNTLNISLKETTSSDIFDIFKEPTQVIDIYVPKNIQLNINALKELECRIDKIEVDTIKIEALKSSFAARDSKINNIDVNAYNNFFGLSNTIVDTVVHEAIKGQFIVEKSSTINNLKSTNNGIISFNDSNINNLDLESQNGEINITNFTINDLKLINRTSEVNISKSNISNSTIEMHNASKLLLDEIVMNEMNLNITTNSYLISSNIIGKNLVISSDMAYIYVDDFKNVENDGILSLKSSGFQSKVEIENSSIYNAEFNFKEGYYFIQDSYIKYGTMVCEESDTIECLNNDGEMLKLYLKGIGSSSSNLKNWISLKSDSKKELVYKIMSWDGISASNLLTDEIVNVDKSEAFINEK